MSKIEFFIQTHQKSRGKTLASSRAFKEVIVDDVDDNHEVEDKDRYHEDDNDHNYILYR